MKKTITVCILALYNISLLSQSNEDKGLKAITESSVKGQLEFLASDWMEGREMGQKGAYMAADYIVSMLKVYGVEPFWEDYYQEFPAISYKVNEDQEFTIKQTSGKQTKTFKFKHNTDFYIHPNEIEQAFQAEVAFVGYGLDDKKNNYNDYEGIDVKGKIILYLNGFPGHKNPGSELYKNFSPGEGGWYMRRFMQSKIKTAEDKGAAGVIVYEKGNMMMWAKTPNYYKSKVYEGEKPFESYLSKNIVLPDTQIKDKAIQIWASERIVNLIMQNSDIDFDQFEKEIIKTLKPKPIILEGIKIDVKTSVDSEVLKCRNIAGIIKGKDTTKTIIVGAHYDHYGMYNGYIWNGADDNASGTVGMLSIAKAFKESGEIPEKNIVFVAFTGEEKGKLGSHYFANSLPKDMQIEYMFNMDMISRNRQEDTAGIQCPVILADFNENVQKTLTKCNVEYKLGLDLIYWPSNGINGGSDHAPFAEMGIPFAFFWTGWHDDYHQPTDEIDKINWSKLLKLCKLGYLHVKYIDKNGL